MAFSFGASTSQQQPAQPAQNSLFSSAAKPATTSFSFGSTPAAPAPSGGGLFGSAQPQQQQQQQQTGGGLFGSTTGQQQPQQQTGGGLFGSQQQQQQPATSGGGLFGSTASQPQQGQQGGGLFGSTTTTTQNTGGGGLFGSTQPQQPAGGGGGLFGSAAQPQQQPQQQQQGGLFGSTTQQQPATGGGLFGSTANQQPAGGGGLFGSTNQQSSGGGLFGSTQQPQQQQQSSGLFGSTAQPQPQPLQPQNQLSQSTLWKSTVGGGVPEPDVETRMMNVKNAWDPASQEHRFKTFVYNVVDQGTTHQYGRQGLTDELWAMATRENPDPTTRVPVAVNGPQDLQKRRQKQIEMAAMQQHISKEISSALRHTRQKAWATDARTRNLQARQTQLHDRLSRLVFQIDQALPSEGSSDASTTSEFIQKLEGSRAELQGGSLKSRESLRAQVNHLRGRIAELRRYPIKQDSAELGWLADPDAQAQVAEILTQHQVALEGLTGLLGRMEFDEVVITKGLTELGDARH